MSENRSVDPRKELLIGGCDRSGTTMVGSMLGVPKYAIATPESHFKEGLIDLGSNLDDKMVRRFLRSSFRFSVWLENDKFFSRVTQHDLSADSGQQVLSHLVRLYHGGSPTVWVDHTPGNVFQFAKIQSKLNNPFFIHLIRDGRDVAASLLGAKWGPSNIVEAALWWREKVLAGANACSVGQDKSHSVRYEDIIKEPKREIRAVCSKCGISYENDMLEGNGFRVPAYTRFQHQAVGSCARNLTKTAQKKLTERQVEIFEFLAGDLLSLYGYRRYYSEPRGPKVWEKSVFRAVSALQWPDRYFHQMARIRALPKLGGRRVDSSI